MSNKIIFSIIGLMFCHQLSAQKTTPTIKSEADVPAYDLPNLLITETGVDVNTAEEWERLTQEYPKQLRAQVHRLLEPGGD